MVKKFFFLICTWFICQITIAQENKFQQEWSFGVNAGLTFSKISFNPSVPQDMILQGSGGLTVRYLSEKNFGIQAELNYSMRGWKEKTDEVSHPNEYSRSISYLELPIMTHIYFDMGKRTRMIFLLGPQIGYNIGENEITREIKSSSEETAPYYDWEVQRAFDYGLIGGLGVELRTGIGNFIIDGRYYFGLSDIFWNKKVDYFQSSSNQVIGVKLTYLFRK